MSKDLRSWLREVQEKIPEELVSISKTVDPEFEATAIATHFDNLNLYPLLVFNSVLDQKKQVSPFRLVTNILGTRKREAVTVGVDPQAIHGDPMAASRAFGVLADKRIPPVRVSRTEAPVKANIWKGDEADLTRLPFVTANEMDADPYGTLTFVSRDPYKERYNISFQRLQVKSPRRAGTCLVPRHLWQYYSRAESEGKDLPVAYVIGHHPAFYENAPRQISLDDDEYAVIGGGLDDPLRVVESETFGDELLVPADAEIIIEGKLLAGVREPEAPFGEWPGHYSPQRMNPVFEVAAITFRDDPIFMNIHFGYPRHDRVGSLGIETEIYNAVRRIVPSVIAVNLDYPMYCSIAMDKKVEGDPKRAAFAALAFHITLEYVFVFDNDVNIFDPREILWGLATRSVASRDIDIIRNVRTSGLDPSQTHPTMTDCMIVDCTKPIDEPFQARLRTPPAVLERVRLRDYVSREQITQMLAQKGGW